MIVSKAEARYVIRLSKNNGLDVTESLQKLSAEGRSRRRLCLRLLRSHFSRTEADTELDTAGVAG